MICKYLEKKIELLPGEDTKDCANPIELEYYLLESEENELNHVSGNKIYGIEIVKKVSEWELECETIKNYSIYKDNTREILNKLANNAVTPIELQFILDDLLGV
ncbi:MAG: DUF6514 family protein [Clostridiales bacterium]|jgi:hypothetical protein|nr:DUF6514 family protein [Eubacteriales bacterium]MDH7565308.1 DUF6514 family protein [Clostridiales bacterium]